MNTNDANKNILIYPELSYKLTGILYEINREHGILKNEKQYCDAIEAKLKNLNINYQREKESSSSFDGEISGRNKADFIIEDKIILEVKAKPFITKNDYYQTLRYTEAFNKKLAILVNMRRYYIHPKRIVNPKFKDTN